MPTLLWRLTIPPLLVALVTLVARRHGSRAAGLVMGLPLTSGPISFTMAIDHGAEWSARAAEATLGAAAAVVVFCVAFALLARRFRWPGAVAGALVAFAFGLGVFHSVRWNVGTGALLLVTVATAVVWGRAGRGSVERATAARSLHAPAWDLPARAAVVFVSLGLVTGLAPRLGPRVCGIVSSLPILTAVMAVFSHRSGDLGATAALLSGTARGQIASIVFFVLVAVLSTRIGVTGTHMLATAGALAVSGAGFKLWGSP